MGYLIGSCFFSFALGALLGRSWGVTRGINMMMAQQQQREDDRYWNNVINLNQGEDYEEDDEADEA